MSSRDYYKVTYTSKDSDRPKMSTLDCVLDNDTEFNANQFTLYDDFTTDLRMNFNPIRNNFQELARKEARRRIGDPNDSGVDMENGNPLDEVTASNDSDLLENEVMVDPWSSMDSSNSPLTDSGPSASEDCTPSTSSEPRGPLDAASPLSPDSRRLQNPKDAKPSTKHVSKGTDKARSRDLTLELETLEPDPLPRRPHFLDEDYQPPSKSNIECRIPKPHFLDHSPSPDEFDERSDITNPNFLDDEVDGDDNLAQKKVGALPKRPAKPQTSTYSTHEDRPHRTSYRSTLHYGLESAARSSERDKRASQLYRGTWPGERDVWTGHDSSSVRSFSSNGSSDCPRPSSNLDNKMDCVFSLISLLSLSPENNADLSAPLLEMSRSVESCIAMRQAGCIPLLVQLIHSKVPRDTRDRAAKALRNIIHTQTDDKAGRREARVWRLLEQVREYCYVLEDVVESRKEGKEVIEDDATKHPSQSVAALMKLSFDEEHRHVVCQLGGLQALAALVSGDQAAHGSRTDDNTCLTMRKYAGMTLTNLTFGDGNNKSLLCSFKDFMLALVEQLESPNDDMRQVTAAVLRNLSWRADTNSKQVLREVGAVKGLTKAAMTCQKEATLKSVLSALWNLTAHCSMNKVALCSVDGALGFLVDMLSYNSPTKTLAIVENAGGIMRNVSSHIAVREDYRQILRERNCLSVLLQHLKSPSLTVVSNSCGTLWNLSARCPQDQEFLWDHGAVPMLRSLIHSKHKMIAMGSSAALKNLLNSKPGKTHIISLDTTARSMNLPALPTLGARKQKALEQELDQNLAETCDNIEPATSPTTSNRDEKNLFTATERTIAMNLERHRMTSSSPLMGTLTSQISLSHSAHLASYLSCSNTLLKGALVTRSATGGSSDKVNRSDSKDSVTSTHSDSVFERVMRTGKVPVPTPRSKDLMKIETGSEAFKVASKPLAKDASYLRFPAQPPIPPPRSTTDMRTNFTESGYDVDQDSCDQPVDYSRKYSETKTTESEPLEKAKTSDTKKYNKKESPSTFGDYQETDLDQPTDYSLRYAEHQSETGSDLSEPPGPSDTIKHFATEGTPYETPIIFSTATSMSDLRVIGKDGKPKTPSTKENPEVMTHSDEKDTCSIEDPPRHDNDLAATTPQASMSESDQKRGVFDTKFSSGMISPEKPVNYCDEGTPGYFSRVSSLSSVGEPTEEDCLAKKNAMATINVEPSPEEPNTSSSAKDKEGSKAVTFAREPVSVAASGGGSPRFVQDTPLMFSRSSSLGSLPDCSHDDQGSVLSEFSRLPSGCISPSEIPDSPGHSAPASPPLERAPAPPEPATPPPEPGQMPSVFEERVSRFVVEHTPAAFSTATSLSSLTIDMEPRDKTSLRLVDEHQQDPSVRPIDDQLESDSERDEIRDHVHHLPPSSSTPNAPYKGTQTPSDVCRVYFTEDTPAILSKAGSNSNLSVLSIDSAPSGLRPAALGASDTSPDVRHAGQSQLDAHDTSDSSNLSDAGDLLEECIQKGIAKVVKNKGPPSDVSSVPYTVRGDVYRSLPPYLRSSTETVKMSHEFARNIRDSRSCSSERGLGLESSPPPPLPPKASAVAPPRPPHSGDLHLDGRRHAERSRRERPTLAHAESASSLSLDSFGSTDREIFEETVKAGLPDQHKAKKPTMPVPIPAVRDGSLSSLSNDSFGSTDKEVFERCVRAGMTRSHPRPRSAERREPRARRARHRDIDRDRRASADRALLRDVIERGAAAGPARLQQQQQHHQHQQLNQQQPATKNAHPPPAPRARAGRGGTARDNTGCDCLDPNLGQDAGCDDPTGVSGQNLNPNVSDTGCDNPDDDPSPAADPLTPEATVNTIGDADIHSQETEHDARVDDAVYLEIDNADARNDVAGLEANLDIHIGQDDAHSGHYSEDEDTLGESLGLEPKPTTGLDHSSLELDQSNKIMSQSTDVRNAEETFKIHSDAYHSILQITEDEFATQSCKPQGRVEPFNYNVTDTSPTSKTNQFDDASDLLKMLEETGPSKSSLAPSIDPLSASRGSNECLAPRSANTTLESLPGDDLDRSNESYADVTDGSWSEPGSPKPFDTGTLTRKKKHELEWVDIGSGSKLPKPEERSAADTWNDDTCPDDVTFPTISGSVHLISSIRSEVVDVNSTLPDLLEKSEVNISLSRPDLTDKLGESHCEVEDSARMTLDDVAEPSFASLVDDGEHRFDSIISSAIEKEAARLAAQLKSSQFGMENSVTSLTSLDLDNVRPPSNLGSLLSLSASGQWEESAAQTTKKSQKSRKKSLPVAMMVKRALSNSMHQGSSEHLDSNPVSFLDNVKPPSEMENIDMEGSMVSVSSIVSEVEEMREKTPVVFDLKQPIQDFPLCSAYAVFQDLDQVNPPSLFDEMAESTIELEPTTAQQVYDDCVSNTLNVVTDIPSGSENCTPIPSDISSVESTPKRQRDPHYLTPKEKRYHSKDRYQTYTITDTVTESDVVLEVDEDFVTWTKSESDRSEEYVTACSDSKSKRKVSAKQRRLEDRARYQTQTVNIQNIIAETSQAKIPDPHIESLKQRLAAKKTMKQKRIEDAERFRTRTLSEDIPPSPTFVTKDANFENVETTTGYDSLSSNELNHQLLLDERHRDDDVFSRDADSGHNEDDFELNSTQMQTYTKSFRNYLPVIESPAAVDMCVVNNLKNIEMTASYRRTMQAQAEKNQHPSSSDFASYEGDSNSEDRAQSESDQESPMSRPKPKIIKPNSRRDESLDSNESLDKEEAPKAIRGRKKAMYVSPYRRSTPAAKKPAAAAASKPTPKAIQAPKTATNVKAHASAKTPNRTPSTSKPPSANTSPKKSIPNRSPTKIAQQKPVSIPLSTPAKPLPLERQGTFTKEESTVPPKDLPVPDRKSTVPQYGKATSPTKPTASNTSPSRLPQLNRYSRPPATKAQTKPAPKAANKRPAETAMKNSPSNHSLQSNDSGKTVTLASRGSRQGSTSSVNSVQSSKNTKDVESKIASLWKRVEQTKKQPSKPDKRVWIESDKTETPKLIRSSTFEGQPKQSQVSSAQKQKSAIGIRVSQIPSLRPKSTPAKIGAPSTSTAKKPANTRVFARKQFNGQLNS
ncbi:hypothetical protein ABMA27_001221 [Loxostege sticticalis]|uniref:Adenomatous polyposis coli protein n=1 Tax=Loxostege sticticalis TaxID=481309 RepID=A0ABR3HXR6_LOXSC